MAVSYEEDFTGELRSHVYSWLRGNKRVAALIEAGGQCLQAIEDEAFDMHESSFLSSARGRMLDAIGSWYGTVRGVLNDSEFRRLIHVTRRAQRSNGELPGLLDIVAVALDDPHPRASPAYPANYRLAFQADASAALLSRIKRLIDDATKIGVGYQLLRHEGKPFTLDHPDLGLDNGQLLEII